ncbi:hypothetical protein JKP88DRAFT_321318 [Tribonema minus]|uniref:PX domain-containing protein n=1 Tax=Tribonema minus TaxID=303371 RepID=A0A836CDC3_9STRA|nr:hypothetical protein JKP88DRAFT_321318 [Tribonema minus]
MATAGTAAVPIPPAPSGDSCGATDDDFGWYVAADAAEEGDTVQWGAPCDAANGVRQRSALEAACSSAQHSPKGRSCNNDRQQWQSYQHRSKMRNLQGVASSSAHDGSSSRSLSPAFHLLHDVVGGNGAGTCRERFTQERRCTVPLVRSVLEFVAVEPSALPYYQSSSQSGAGDAEHVSDYAIGISAVRIASGRHAEYQVVFSSDKGTWTAWRRYTQFKALMDQATKILSSGGSHSTVWERLQRDMKLGRCLDPDYLALKRRYLECYLSQLLFALPTADLLQRFVTADDRRSIFGMTGFLGAAPRSKC